MLVSNNQINFNTPSRIDAKKVSVKNITTNNNEVTFGYYTAKPSPHSALISNFLKANATQIKPASTQAIQAKATSVVVTPYKNNLRTLFQNNEAVIYAMIPRTFNAKDTNGDELISANEQRGTFINAIERLDEMKALGVNTFHILPIHPPGVKEAMGTAGSIYAPSDLLKIDPKLDDPNNPMTVEEEMKLFNEECHKRGIKVMVDLPSCAALDLYYSRPELMAINEQGFPEVPQGWQDIRMFEPWEDEEKGILNKELVDLHKKYVDMLVDLGVDGIRADVARAKPMQFWNEIIPYARSKDPEFAFLAECYTYEDASPMANVPADRPADALAAGFDSYYGQYHIFHEWADAGEFHDNMIQNLDMSHKLPAGKSLIGSFATHDDKSPMANGGVKYCNLTTGLQMTLPMTNPYVVTGFESGDRYIYQYQDKFNPVSDTDCNQNIVHPEKLDIFNYSRKPGGENPEIGQYMSEMAKLRNQYSDVITHGSYIPLATTNKDDQIIAYARHLNGKTLLVVANKDVNSRQKGSINIPGMQNSTLTDLAPASVGISKQSVNNGTITVDLAPAMLHVFEINAPNIEQLAPRSFKQNLDGIEPQKNLANAS